MCPLLPVVTPRQAATEDPEDMPKKLINAPEDVVEEMVDGILLAHPCLTRLEGLTVLLRRDFAEVKSRQVTLISGAPPAGGRPHVPTALRTLLYAVARAQAGAVATSPRTPATSGRGCSR